MAAPEFFGRPKSVKEQIVFILMGLGGWDYKLVRSVVWVNAGLAHKVPHRYRSWYRQARDGQRKGPIPESEISLYTLEVAFGKGTTDPPQGLIVDAMDLALAILESSV